MDKLQYFCGSDVEIGDICRDPVGHHYLITKINEVTEMPTTWLVGAKCIAEGKETTFTAFSVQGHLSLVDRVNELVDEDPEPEIEKRVLTCTQYLVDNTLHSEVTGSLFCHSMLIKELKYMQDGK